MAAVIRAWIPGYTCIVRSSTRPNLSVREYPRAVEQARDGPLIPNVVAVQDIGNIGFDFLSSWSCLPVVLCGIGL